MAKGGLDTFGEDRCSSILSKISPKYVADRVYLSYTQPPSPDSNGICSQAEMEEWLSRMNEIEEDLIWLLELPYNRFWSQFAFDDHVTGVLTSYVQNTVRPYELEEENIRLDHLNSSKIMESQDKIHALVLAVYVRLSEFDGRKDCERTLTSSEFGDLIYEKFIFDIPTVFDICLIYGNSNHEEVVKIIDAVFTNQKFYLGDLDEAVKFAVKTLTEIVQKAKDVSLVPPSNINSYQENSVILSPLEDLICYLLDIMFSLSSFFEFFPPACDIFLKHKVECLICDIYNNTIPLLYCHVGELCLVLCDVDLESRKPKRLKIKLRLLREEIIKTFHHIVAYLVNGSLQCRFRNEEEGVKNHVNNFLDVWHDCLAYDIFVKDYNQMFPIHKDILIIKEVNNSEVVNEKVSFLMEAVSSYSPVEKKKPANPKSQKEEEIPSAASASLSERKENDIQNKSTYISEVELQCRISSVSDILSDISVDIIRNYLLSMDCSVEKTVDAILRDSVAGIPLTEMKPPESACNSMSKRLNVFDGDEFDIMVHDQIDMSKVNIGKKKEKYKDIKDLIDDKSHRREMAEMYQRLGIVNGPDISNVDIDAYDDEYDDTYDDNEAYSRRSFVVPRVLREVSVDSPESSESEDEDSQVDNEGPKVNDQFVTNPAEIREKMEQRQMTRNPSQGGSKGKDVVGKPKGQGQDHSTQINRQRKSTNKASRANHNRKSRSMRKQQQGMF